MANGIIGLQTFKKHMKFSLKVRLTAFLL